jgi:hypothetical protein
MTTASRSRATARHGQRARSRLAPPSYTTTRDLTRPPDLPICEYDCETERSKRTDSDDPKQALGLVQYLHLPQAKTHQAARGAFCGSLRFGDHAAAPLLLLVGIKPAPTEFMEGGAMMLRQDISWVTPLFSSHLLAGAADVTSSVITLKPASVHGPNEVTIATSVASRPRAIKMRPIRGLLWRASNVYQRPPR